MKDIDPDGMVKTHPMTAKALQDENFAKIAHDDVENLKGLEDSFSVIGRTPSSKPLSFDQQRALTVGSAAFAFGLIGAIWGLRKRSKSIATMLKTPATQCATDHATFRPHEEM